MFNKRPHLFRICFVVLGLPLLALAMVYSWLMINLGSVESYYQASRSRLYVAETVYRSRLVRVFPGRLSFRKDHQPRIQQGDLLIAVNGVSVNLWGDVLTAIENLSQDGNILVTVQRPTRHDYFLEYEVRAEDLRGSSIWETPPTVYVWRVPRGGASHLAGILPGDLIHEINSRTFADHQEADRLVSGMLRGQSVRFGIIRNNSFLNLDVTMARLTIPTTFVVYLLVGLLWVVSGIFLALFRFRYKAGRLLGTGFFLIGNSFLLYEDRGGLISHLSSDQLRLLSAFLLFMGLSALIHANYYFPHKLKPILKRPMFRYQGYLLALIATPVVFLHGVPGLGLGFAFLLIPQIWIRFRHLEKRNPQQQSLEQYIMSGAVFGLVSIITWSFLRDQMSQSWDLIVRSITGLIVLMSFGVTIARFRLLGITIKRNLQYSVFSIVWVLFVSVLCFYVLTALSHSRISFVNINLTPRDIEFHDRAQSPEQMERNQKLTLMLVALGLGYVALRFGRWGQGLLRLKFYRGSYDFQRVSDELGHLLSENLQLADLARGLSERVVRLMLIKRAAVILFGSQGETVYLEAKGFREHSLKDILDDQGPLVYKELAQYRAEFDVEDLDAEVRHSFLSRELFHGYTIYAKDRLLGCILIGEKLSEAPFHQKDFRFLSAASRQASVALENGMLYEKLAEQERFRHELELARHIQISSLPQGEPEIAGLDVAGTSIPAQEVGGDYYAYFVNGEDQLTLILGDVSGKGTSAALYMSKMQGIFSTLCEEKHCPADLFYYANRILYREMENTAFVTAICAQFDAGQRSMKMARAGHLPLLHYRAQTKDCCSHKPAGIGLGLEQKGLFEQVLEEMTLGYEQGDVFVFLSDGLTEVVDENGQLFGEPRIETIIEDLAHKPACDIRNDILSQVNLFAMGEASQDDQTIVVVKAL